MKRHGFSVRVWLGLLAGAYAGAAALHKRDKNIMVYDAPRASVTVVIARGKRARELREYVEEIILDGPA